MSRRPGERPRAEHIITRERATVQEALDVLEVPVPQFDKVRARLEELLSAAERAYAESLDLEEGGVLPEWAGGLRYPGPLWCRDKAQDALAQLATIEAHGSVAGSHDGTKTAAVVVGGELAAACAGIFDPNNVTRRDEDRIGALRQRLDDLDEELAQRRAGAGEKRPYRVLHGCVHGRRRGGVVELDAWEVESLARRGHPTDGPMIELIEPENQEAA